MSARSPRAPRPTLAVWKFASCDGCQLSLLDCEDELLLLAGAVRIAHFTEVSRRLVEGPYDLSLVEGSITTRTTPSASRRSGPGSRTLVTIGACATAGGIQALRNFADAGEYAAPSTPIPSTSPRCHLDARSRTMSPSTTSSTAARSTATSCSR